MPITITRPYRIFLSALFLLFGSNLFSQNVESYKNLAWAGGLNAAQFFNMDINKDGTKDILVFDRHGNRVLPFIKNLNESEYHPEFSYLFPNLHDWVIIKDYDGDGKEDIFTYGQGGARVFHNISTDSLRFELVTDYLKSWYYTGEVGILITNVDYPGIEDIDGDGDLDLVTFFGLGSYVEFHRNMSMENYGNRDHLKFRLADKCWGDFREGIESNHITLNIVCPYKYDPLPLSCNNNSRHTGSTFFVKDLNGDNVKDLILGDVDYPGIITLMNGGNTDSAHMISQDTISPFLSNTVHLFSFPVITNPDINNDGIKDAIVSSFDPSLISSENFRSCWYYRNAGTEDFPQYLFVKERFLQDDMIDLGSGAYPVLADIDGDGLTDLLAGNFGYYDSSWYEFGMLHSSYVSKIAFFRNTGSEGNPAFTLITDDLGGLSSLKATGLYPACADIDGDGLADIIAGRDDGSLIFLKNKGISDHIPLFEPPVLHFQNIDPGEYSTPQLFDLDRDGLTDLITGEKAGNLNYYRNTGTSGNPSFTKVTDSLGKINVTNYNLSYDGYSTPCFFRENDGSTSLLAGSEEGIIHYYKGIDGNLEGQFFEINSYNDLVSLKKIKINAGIRTAPAIAHLTSGNYFDLIEGNYCGGFNYLSDSDVPKVITGEEKSQETSEKTFEVFPNPADKIICITSKMHSDFEVRILNQTGKNIKAISASKQTIIDISNLPSGFYILKISPLPVENDPNPLIFKSIIIH